MTRHRRLHRVPWEVCTLPFHMCVCLAGFTRRRSCVAFVGLTSLSIAGPPRAYMHKTPVCGPMVGTPTSVDRVTYAWCGLRPTLTPGASVLTTRGIARH